MQAGILRFFIKLLPAMKRYLPHLLYIALIAAVGLFHRQRISTDNQWIALFNRTTDEALLTAGHYNGEMQKGIRKEAKEYPSPKDIELALIASKADSLIRVCDTNAALRDSLSSRLWILTDRDPGLSKDFQTPLPSKKQAGVLSEYQSVLSQNDSLRKHWALAVLLNYCKEQMRSIQIICRFGAQPLVSYTTICPFVGQSFESDIVINDYFSLDVFHLTVNGQALQIKEGLAHYKNTYPKSGLYPLHVKAESWLWGNDSLTLSEKTFYLHVNN